MSKGSLLFQLALLVRLPNSFTVLANVIAAYTIGSAGEIKLVDLSVLLIMSLSFYYAGMIQNDCVDLQEDSKTQAHRPLPSGKISLQFAWLLFTILALLGLALSLRFSLQTTLIAAALLSCIVFYNLSGRESLYGCVLMGSCRSLNWLMVLSAVGAATNYLHFAIVVGLYVMALTFLSRDENYAKNKMLVVFAAVSFISAAVLMLLFIDTQSSFVQLKWLLVLAMLSVVLFKLYALARDYRSEKIRELMMFLILGMIPLDAILVLIAGHPWASLVVLSMFAPGRFLARKMYTT